MKNNEVISANKMKARKSLSLCLTAIYISVLLLAGGCGKQYIQPSLKSLVNTHNETLSFDDTHGNVQTINVGVKRSFHGTGPMTPKQESLSIAYYISTNGDGFKLVIDGDGVENDQHIRCLLPWEQPNGTYSYDHYDSGFPIYPFLKDFPIMNDYVSEETQLDLNGRVYDHVLKICFFDKCDNPSYYKSESLKTIFLAKGYGLVAFTNIDDTSFYLVN